MGDDTAPIGADQDYVVRMVQELIRMPAENPPSDCTDVAERDLVAAEMGPEDIFKITICSTEPVVANP